jgi:hypothetical protein
MSLVTRVALAAVGLVSGIIGIGVAPASFWAWWYPGPLIALPVAALAASFAYLRRVTRATSIEQGQLDRILEYRPRRVIRGLEKTDFSGGWRRDLTFAVGLYAAERGEPEDRFLEPTLEELRQELYAAAVALDEATGQHAFAARTTRHWVDIGWSGGELDYADERTLEIAQRRSMALQAARDPLVDAHPRWSRRLGSVATPWLGSTASPVTRSRLRPKPRATDLARAREPIERMPPRRRCRPPDPRSSVPSPGVRRLRG